MKGIKGSLIISFMITFFGVALTPVQGICDYKLSMLPRLSAEEINKRITPLAQYLTGKTGLTITPVVTASFAQYQKKMQSGAIHVGYSNPYIYTLVSDTHEVIAMADKGEGGTRFRGIIITRSDSPLKVLDDLKGKKVSFVGKTSAGGFLSQKLTLMEKGIDVKEDLYLEEAVENKHENVIFAVFTGDVDAGFIRESAFDKADNFIPASSLRILDRTAWLPNWALSVNRSLSENEKKEITKSILDLTPDSPVLKALGINRFVPASDQDYNSVRKAAGIDQINIINIVH